MSTSPPKVAERVDLARSLPFTSMLEEHELQAFAKVLTLGRYAVNQTLFEAGQPAQKLCFVVSGQVTVSVRMGRSKKVVDTVEPGMMVGHTALISRQVHDTTAVASKNTVALELSREMFDRVLRSDAPLALKLTIPIVTACCRTARSNHQMLHGLYADPHGTLAELFVS